MTTTPRGGTCRNSGKSVDEVNKKTSTAASAKGPHMVPCSIESPCDAGSDATNLSIKKRLLDSAGGGGGGVRTDRHVPIGEHDKRQCTGTKEPSGAVKEAGGIIQGVKRTGRGGRIGAVRVYRCLRRKRWSHEFRSRTTSRGF